MYPQCHWILGEHSLGCSEHYHPTCGLVVTGALEERGMIAWNKVATGNSASGTRLLRAYDLPFGMRMVRRTNWTRYIPLCPTFRMNGGSTEGANEDVSVPLEKYP